MLAILMMGAAGGAWVIWRTLHAVAHGIPRANDDLIFI